MKPLLAFSTLLLITFTMHAETIYDISIDDIDGTPSSLSDYTGKAILIVNVASACGYTPQYTGLEALYENYKDQGLIVLGVPCNQFGSQESGTNAEIKEFCSTQFHVTFPMSTKVDVNGDNRHPLYEKLVGDNSPFPGNIAWNFTKFLISKDGTIINRFESAVKPDSEEIIAAIETALKD